METHWLKDSQLGFRRRLKRSLGLLAVTTLCWAGSVQAALLPPTLKLDLKPPSISAGSAFIDIWVSIEGEPGDLLLGVTLDVSMSSDALTGSDTDYSRFMFVPSGDPAFTGWGLQQFGYSSPGVLAPEVDRSSYWNWPTLAPGLSPADASKKLGTIQVDLAGVDLNTSPSVKLLINNPMEGDATTGIYLPSGSGSSNDIAFTNAAWVAGSGEIVLPEPSSLALLGLISLGLTAGRKTRRQRG